MPRYRNLRSGVVVNVRDGKELGPDWGPADGTKRRRRSPRKGTKAEDGPTASPTAAPAPGDDDDRETFVVSEHTVDDVLAFVGDDPELAAEVLASETADGGKNRSSLVTKLEQLVAGDDDS